MLMSDNVALYMRAGFSGIWLQSNEHEDAIKELTSMCQSQNWGFRLWNMDCGLVGPNGEPAPDSYKNQAQQLVTQMPNIAAGTRAPRTLFVLQNFHRREFADNAAVLQSVQSSVAQGKSAENGWCICILTSSAVIPQEWLPSFIVVDHPLPDGDQLWEIARDIAEGAGINIDNTDQSAVRAAAAGLTRYEAESAFSLSLLQRRELSPGVIWDLKAQSLKKQGKLTLYNGNASFDQMGGLSHFKEFSSKLLEARGNDPLLYSKGLLLLGVPGAGKSQAVRCLGNLTGRRVLTLDVGALRSKYVGDTERNIREALRIADAMQPCILFVDEIEKALAGVGSSGATDGGVGARVFGTLLTWLNDRTSDVFFAGTCNDIGQLIESNPEFIRAERFDGIFFFDLPTESEREAIWRVYLDMFGYEDTAISADMLGMSDGWTGAEIKTCCRLSAILKLPFVEAAKFVVPISKTSGTKQDDLRNWANGKCLSASYPGLFSAKEPASAKKRRVSL